MARMIKDASQSSDANLLTVLRQLDDMEENTTKGCPLMVKLAEGVRGDWINLRGMPYLQDTVKSHFH